MQCWNPIHFTCTSIIANRLTTGHLPTNRYQPAYLYNQAASVVLRILGSTNAVFIPFPTVRLVMADAKRRRVQETSGLDMKSCPTISDEEATEKMNAAKVGAARSADTDPKIFTGFKDINSAMHHHCRGDDTFKITPMGYFLLFRNFDPDMIKWLKAKGACVRATDCPWMFPLYIASEYANHDIVNWLLKNGASGDIRRASIDFEGNKSYPLTTAIRHKDDYWNEDDRMLVCRRLVMEGALGDPSNGFMSGDEMVDILLGSAEVRLKKWLLDWVDELHREKNNFVSTVLMGACAASDGTTRTNSPLRSIGGVHLALKTIASFCGLVVGRQAQIVSELKEKLPVVIDIVLQSDPVEFVRYSSPSR